MATRFVLQTDWLCLPTSQLKCHRATQLPGIASRSGWMELEDTLYSISQLPCLGSRGGAALGYSPFPKQVLWLRGMGANLNLVCELIPLCVSSMGTLYTGFALGVIRSVCQTLSLSTISLQSFQELSSEDILGSLAEAGGEGATAR